MDEGLGPAELEIAVRVFGTRPRPDRVAQQPGRRARRADPSEALIFDTETATGPSQRLQIGAWRLFSDRAGAEPGVTCVEEGLFYADDLEVVDPDGFARLKEYVRRHADAGVAPGFPSRLRLMSASSWLQKRLFRYGYQHRTWAHSDVVGFNLTFDLGRLASHASEAGGDRGAFSLGLWGSHDDTGRWHDTKYHPRLIVRSIDPRRTLYSWGSLKKEDTTGATGPARFVDLHTLVFALTDQNHSLETAGAAFGDPWEKDPIPYGVIDARSLDYARDDVRHTAILYRACLAELRLHTGVDLDAPRLYSPATVGTRYLEAIGVAHPLERFMADPELVRDAPGVTVGQRIHPRLIGYAMGGFFGGRAEARLVRSPMPVTLVDGTSLYPTVNANLRTWELLTADRIEVIEATDPVAAFLSAPGLVDRVLERAAWSEAIGVTLVEVADPEGDILPVRALYDPKGRDPGIGINPLTYAGSLWYLFPDVIAAALLTGRPPRIARALRLVGVGRQSKLRPVALRGGRMIDPFLDDPFVRIVEERHRIDRDLSRSKDERARLSRFLKITANATAFGIMARFDRRELATAIPVTAWGPDETPRTTNQRHPEDPGPYTFPPIAATITAAARLMLALLERLVTDAGGTYVFCDTDSMAIVARPPSGELIHCPTPDGRNEVTGLDRATTQAILARFEGLNPYDTELAIPVWKVEHDSLERPVACYAISAKRYLLYRPATASDTAEVVQIADEAETAEGEAEVGNELTDWSEHGLGLYLSPLIDERGRAVRDEEKRRVWVRDGWRWVLDDALGATPEPPPWADLPAVTRFTISSPALLGWFRGRDQDLPPAERMHPGGFGLLAHPAEEDAEHRMPSGPYEPNPALWTGNAWYDRRSHQQLRITTEDPIRSPERFAADLASGALRVRTLGEILATYDQRPEHKSLSPDRSPTGARTVGLLRCRPVRSSPARTLLSGKEGNKLTERLAGMTTEREDYRTEYGTRADPWFELVVPVLRRMGAGEVVQRTDPGWRRSIERIIKEGRPPKQRERVEALTRAAVAYAREQIGDSAPDAKLGPLTPFLAQPPRLQQCACGCGRPVPSIRAKWFNEACRKRAARRAT